MPNIWGWSFLSGFMLGICYSDDFVVADEDGSEVLLEGFFVFINIAMFSFVVGWAKEE